MSGSLADLREAFARVWAFRWMYAVPIATILLPVTLYVYSLPDTYEATAVVRVRELNRGGRQDLPEERQARAAAIVSTTPAELMAPENLVAMARVLEPEQDPTAIGLLTELRERIKFQKKGGVGFTVGLADTDPHRASEAVNVLLETFFAGQVDGLLKQALSRRSFREEQLLTAGDKYDAAAKNLDDFRKEYAATLPEAEPGLQNELVTVRSERATWVQMASAAKGRRDLLDQELARPRRTPGPRDPRVVQENSAKKKLEDLLRELEDQKREIERELQVERATHKEKHYHVVSLVAALQAIDDDITATKKAIEKLEAKPTVGASEAEGGEEGSSEEPPSEEAPAPEEPKPDVDDPLMRFMRTMRESAAADFERASAHAEELRERRDTLHDLLGQIPRTATAMSSLVNALKREELRRTEAEKALAKASELADFFTFEDPAAIGAYELQQRAVAPAEPTGPKRAYFILAAAGIGAALGYGLMLLRRKFEHYAVTRPRDLLEYAQAAMIVTVPMLPDGRHNWRKTAGSLREFALGGWVLLCVTVVGVAVAGHHGWIESPAWLGDLLGLFP